MDRVVKLIFATAFAASVLAACNKNAGGVKVNTPRSGKPGATKTGDKNAKTGDSTAEARGVDAAKLTPAQKETAADIKALRPLFRNADGLFNEFWPKIIAPDSPKRENIFKFIFWTLDSNFTPKGVPFKPEEISKEKEKAKASCTIGLSEVKKVGLVYEIHFAPCTDLMNSQKVAEIAKHTDRWRVTFDMKTMGSSPQDMMGKWISTLHSDLESICDLAKMPNGNLGTLSCTNIGQDINENKYALIKELKFKYPRELKNQAGKLVPLTLEYDVFEMKAGKPDKVPSKAIDDYVTNTFVIDNFVNQAPPEVNDDAVNAKVAADYKANQAEESARLKREEEERRGQQLQQQQQTQPATGQEQQEGEPDPKDNASGISSGIQHQSPSNPSGRQDPNQQNEGAESYDQGQRQEYPPAT